MESRLKPRSLEPLDQPALLVRREHDLHAFGPARGVPYAAERLLRMACVPHCRSCPAGGRFLLGSAPRIALSDWLVPVDLTPTIQQLANPLGQAHVGDEFVRRR